MEYITVTEAAARAGVSVVWVRKEIREGRLRGYKVSGAWRILPEDFAAWQAGQAPAGEAHAPAWEDVPPDIDGGDYMTVPEAVELTGAPSRTIRRRAAAGKIPAVCISGIWYIRRGPDTMQVLADAKTRMWHRAGEE